MCNIDNVTNKLNELHATVSGIRMTLATATACDVEAIANLFKVIDEIVIDILNSTKPSDALTDKATETTTSTESSVDPIDAIAKQYSKPSDDSPEQITDIRKFKHFEFPTDMNFGNQEGD